LATSTLAVTDAISQLTAPAPLALLARRGELNAPAGTSPPVASPAFSYFTRGRRLATATNVGGGNDGVVAHTRTVKGHLT